MLVSTVNLTALAVKHATRPNEGGAGLPRRASGEELFERLATLVTPGRAAARARGGAQAAPAPAASPQRLQAGGGKAQRTVCSVSIEGVAERKNPCRIGFKPDSSLAELICLVEETLGIEHVDSIMGSDGCKITDPQDITKGESLTCLFG